MSDTVKVIIEIPKAPKNDHERWVLAHGIPLDDVKEPKNGERFSCPNCGFKADWFIPSKENNTKESK